MKQLIALSMAVLFSLLTCGCSDSVDSPGGSEKGSSVASLHAAIDELRATPEHDALEVEVQHILIAFDGTLGPKPVGRDRNEAEALAADLLSEIEGGADFDALVKQHTDDSHPGIYPMTKSSRRGMVQGFGDVAWRLPVGGVGVTPHDPATSKFGWHIIKRLK